MAKCYCCGADVPDSAKFCPKCGKTVEVSQDLIDRAKADDPDAQTELYERTYKTVYSRIRAKVPDEDTAMDIMQETYLSAFTNLNQLQKAETFPSWLLTIASRQACDWYRKNRKENENVRMSELEYENDDTISDDDDILEEPEYRQDFSPDESLDRAETGRLLSEILDILPEDQRIILVMRYYDEMSLQEISEELGVNLSTVKTRLTAGKKKVEAKVLELEKSGTKLYSLGPMAFLVFLLHHAELFAPTISANAIIGLTAAGTGAAAGGAAAGAAAHITAATAAKTAVAAAAKGISVKVAAIVAAAVVVVGGGTTAAVIVSNNNSQTEEVAASNRFISTEAVDTYKDDDAGSDNAVTDESEADKNTESVEPETERIFLESSGKSWSEEYGFSWTTYEYDSNGNEIGLYNLDENGNRISSFLHSYDEQGRKLSEVHYNQGNVISSRVTYKYNDEEKTCEMTTEVGNSKSYTNKYYFDDNGNELKQEYYDLDSGQPVLDNWAVFQYDIDGNQTERINYDSDGTIKLVARYEYDERGNRIKSTSWDSYGGEWKVGSMEECEYNDVGTTKYSAWESYEGSLYLSEVYVCDPSINTEAGVLNGIAIIPISETYYNADGTVGSYIETVYNEQGDIIESRSGNGTGITDISTYQLKYDDNWNLISSEYYHNDELISTAIYEYDEFGNVLSVYQYDIEGNMYAWSEYEYVEISQ